jgi:hypothetical protein
MDNDIDFVSLVDLTLSDMASAGVPLLPFPISQAIVAVMCNGMAEPDRSRLVAEIIVCVNRRIGIFKRKQQDPTSYQKYPA